MLHHPQALEQLHKGARCQLVAGLKLQHLQLDCVFGQTGEGLIADRRTVVEVDCLQVVEVLSDEGNALLRDLAPLYLQSFEFTLPHCHQTH